VAIYTIQVPDMGGVRTYTVSDENYDIKIQKITQDRIRKSGSSAFAEMVAVTKAVADGQITFKNGIPGGIKELDKHIDISLNGFLAFYVI
jgi:hypothetical protein